MRDASNLLAVLALAMLLPGLQAQAPSGESAGASELLQAGDQAFSAMDYAGAQAHYARAVEAARAAGEQPALAESLAALARSLLIQDKKDEGKKVLAEAVALDDPESARAHSRILGVRGRFEWKDGDLAMAKVTFVEMYGYCREHELFDRAVDAAHMVAIVGDEKEQIEWAHRGIEAAVAGGHDGWLGPLWNNLGATHEDAGRYEEALDAYLKARHYHWLTGNEVNKLLADWAVGHACRLAGDPTKAAQWLRPVLAWAERRHAEVGTTESGEVVGLACRDLGLIAAAAGRRDEALELLHRAHALLAAAGMAEWAPEDMKELEQAIERLE